MEIPHRPGARPYLALPETVFSDSNLDHNRTSSRSSSYNSTFSASSHAMPMPIKGSKEYVPPPLPPPKDLADIRSGGSNGPDLAWRFANSESDIGSLGSSTVASGSSLYGGNYLSRKRTLEERPDYSRRTSSTSTTRPGDHEHGYPRDEGYSSYSTASSGSHRSNHPDSLSARSFQSFVHDTYQTNAQAYDKSLLQKLDARSAGDKKTPPRSYSKMSAFSSSASDASPKSRVSADYRHPHQLKPLSVPTLSSRLELNSTESPTSFWRPSDNPLSSAVSPGIFPRLGIQTQVDHRSLSDAESDRSPHPYIRGSGSSSAMSFGDDSSITSRSKESYDLRVSPDHDVDFHMEETALRKLHIEDSSVRQDPHSPSAITGQKRRASSPLIDDGPSLHTVGSASDLFRRRESASRCSPTPRLHTTAGSMSSTTSGQRANSYASSTLSIITGSVSSMDSYARSPIGLSSGGMESSDSPYMSSMSLNPSPRGSNSARGSHQRNTSSETRPLLSSRQSDGLGAGKPYALPKNQGIYMCECCPKKPKKFECQEDLDAHEQEKQYQCAYCNNRFKNKNEAERHQNSLHLRRHSWSCAALSGYPAAFHESSTRPNEADSCGYCGEDFPRSGLSSPSVSGPQIPIATDRDWDVRISHLQEMHKFGECNHAKKFFRADHFRQHLKHSHAGTSGKWTNMLENACMKDEPLPVPIRGPERVSPGGRVSRISEEDEML